MSEAGYFTLTCPHCAKRLRAPIADAGQQVRCPHPDCLRAVAVPRASEEDEPDEPVLLPEDPAEPQSVPVSSASIPSPRPKPRHEEEEPSPRAVTLPWLLTALACMLASAAVTGWVMTATRDRPTHASNEAVAALEAKNRELQAENQKFREQLNASKPAAPAPTPKGSDVPAPAPANNPWVAPLDRNPPPKPPDEPKPPKVDPPAKPPEGRDAFVGKWSVNDPQLQRLQADVTFEFRADGTSSIEIQTMGVNQSLSGTWRWDGRKLHLEIENIPGGKPAEVKWNGPDEFVGTADNMPVTFRRKR